MGSKELGIMVETVYCPTCEKAYAVPNLPFRFYRCLSGHPLNNGQPAETDVYLPSFRVGDTWEKLESLIKGDHIWASGAFRRTEREYRTLFARLKTNAPLQISLTRVVAVDKAFVRHGSMALDVIDELGRDPEPIETVKCVYCKHDFGIPKKEAVARWEDDPTAQVVKSRFAAVDCPECHRPTVYVV
jgi:hypothetical protein